jgi:hypothetical protein
VIAAAVIVSPASAATFSNSTPITTPGSGGGAANPYPSTISVGGLPGTTVKVQVTLADIFAAARDIDALLTGPGGSSMLMSDICQAGGVVPDLIHLTYTFDDPAAQALPASCTGAPPSGTYQPTDYDTSDSFPSVPPPYPVGFAPFQGVSPNGDWRLYVFDDGFADAVSIGGWSLDLTTTGAPPAKKKKCKKKHRRRAAESKKRCKKKKRR